MAEVNQELFHVLRQLGANEEQAFTGASHDDVITGVRADVADIKRDMHLLKWMVATFIGLQIALGVGNLWLSVNIVSRLP